MQGINLVGREGAFSADLCQWYSGPTLIDLLGKLSSVQPRIDTVDAFVGHPDKLVPPVRDITSPLRFPISNVFKQQNVGAAVSGRLCGGVVQVGEKLRVLPGDETAIVKCEDALSPYSDF